jgi:hypothetical protein
VAWQLNLIGLLTVLDIPRRKAPSSYFCIAS